MSLCQLYKKCYSDALAMLLNIFFEMLNSYVELRTQFWCNWHAIVCSQIQQFFVWYNMTLDHLFHREPLENLSILKKTLY